MEFCGIEKMSLVDYNNKISCILFTEGCNFRCPWCHNSFLVTDLSKNKPIPFNEILSYLEKRKNLLDAVVISGGEPTLMEDLKSKIISIRKLGFLIKLDTNGSNPEILKDLVESKLIDYVAMDIKNSFLMYALTVGLKKAPLDKIKESIKFLISNKVDYEFRTTLIDEYFSNDSINEMGSCIKGAKRIFLQKFIDNDHCISHGLHEVNEKKALDYLKLLEKYVDKVELRGY